MDCTRFREIISARLDDEETPAEMAALDTHLAGCPGCRRDADLMAQVTRAARVTGWCSAEPDLVDGVLAAHDRAAGAAADGVPAAASSPPVPRVDAAQAQGCHRTLRLVGTSGCGCSPRCGCGCQDGRPCRCGVAA